MTGCHICDWQGPLTRVESESIAHEGVVFHRSMHALARVFQEPFEALVGIFQNLTRVMGDSLVSRGTTPPVPPGLDAKELALWRLQHRNTGPSKELNRRSKRI